MMKLYSWIFSLVNENKSCNWKRTLITIITLGICTNFLIMIAILWNNPCKLKNDFLDISNTALKLESFHVLGKELKPTP